MRQLTCVTVEAGSECVRPLRDMVGTAAGDAGATDTEISIIKFCVSEAITNAVEHAYPEGHAGPIEVSARVTGDAFLVTVADRGRGARQTPSRPHGGFGLAFVERLTDGCSFTARPRGTTVQMAFALPRRRTGRPEVHDSRVPNEHRRILELAQPQA